MGLRYGRDGFLRGTPPYSWRQWLLAGVAWAALMFLIFDVLSGFRHVIANAIIWSTGGVLWALVTRQLIVMRERRARHKTGR